MATYNGEKFLHEQIESILVQLEPDDELIISDDGSSDNTLNIIKSFNDSRIKIFYNTSTHGVNGNFENALRNAKGEYIFLSDQDDVWLHGKIEACINELKNVDCVIHDAIITDSELIPIGLSFFETVNANPGFIKNWIHNGYLGCAMAFKRIVLEKALPIPQHSTIYHDVWIGNIAALKFKVKFIKFKGIKFRRHNNNTSITFHKKLPFIKLIKNRIDLFFLLFRRLIFKKALS